MIGLVQKLYQSAQLFSPYFTNKGSAQKNRWLLASYLALNIFEAAIIMILYSYLSAFMGLLALPVITYQLFFSALIEFTGALLVVGLVEGLNYLSYHQLKMSLVDNLNQDLSGSWLKNEAFYGFRLRPQASQPDPSKIFEEDIHEVVDYSMFLLDGLLRTTANFGIGVYKLWQMSTSFVINVLGREIVLPGIMVIASVLYAIGYNMISGAINDNLNKDYQAKKESEEQLQKVIHHIDEHREAIAIQKSALREKTFYDRAFDDYRINRQRDLNNKTKQGLLEKMHGYLALAFGLIISAPSIIAKKVQASEIFEINNYFSGIINFFTATQTNIHTIAKLDAATNRIIAFKKSLKSWKETKLKQSTLTFNQPEFEVHDLCVSTPDGKTLLERVNFQFHQGKITLFKGETGSGKSTLIKTMAGLWPYSQGAISFPIDESELMVIPQNPCFPFKCTLLETITYRLKPGTTVSRERVIEFMQKLKLDHKVDQLDVTDSWSSSSSLSGGEKQRIALISAVLSKPKLLLLDESLGKLDEETKQLAKLFIQDELPDTSILIVDHSDTTENKSVVPFYNHSINLKNKQLKEPKKGPLDRSPSSFNVV